ncbi:uncharacterized protein OCT59_026544 [Rhizophagus irregularis]|uniref:F-box domain-containing protein n=1 Tax=Rhizophagus irregularis (strain DAOM 197198w) TaxID=1432141 RepID=A0A015KE46_RHIIW|nr:hypothetical protein RirG_130720 [Rhizophagus irregularis DAOM 197198w]UZO06213.1 hypothetical protein OCT59_026544 [Rhizophagus irregularis]CAB4482949.1 unnamed protein product [Rhizophagus irregularis]
MPELNKDILFLIFEELKKDSKSLFSCLMVNRLWCETVIPILWKNPWCYNINYRNKNSLYSFIISYLSDDIKESLISQEIFLPPILHQPLLFDYLSFCRSIDVDILNDIISIGTSESYNQFLLQLEIYNLLMRKCSQFKYINIRSLQHQIFYFPGAKTRLESLCELECDTYIDSSYFHGLARICQNIQRLIIINRKMKINHGLVKLIENQRNLKYFELKDDFDDEDFIEDPYKEIFLALAQKADALNHLILFLDFIDCYEHTIIQDVLTKLHKLKTLIINNVYVYFSEIQLKMLVYHELEAFNIDFTSLNEASAIIENSGGHLRGILLRYIDYGYWYDNLGEDSLNFICKVHQNCPSVEYLSLLFLSTADHFTEFETLLKSCQTLKSLLLSIPSINKEETGEKLLKILIRSAPKNLREIRFFKEFQFSLKNLETFFKNWKDRPALTILTSDPIYKGDDYMKLIDKYKENGVIREFRCDPGRNNIYY